MTGEPPGGVWFELEERIEATPEEVFAYFTEPERYTRWMGTEADLDARPGGIYRVRMTNEAIASGVFVAVEPFRRVVFTWGWEGEAAVGPGSTTIEVTFEQDDGGTLVRLRHSGLPDEDAGAKHEEGWTMYLSRLRVVAAGGDLGPQAR